MALVKGKFVDKDIPIQSNNDPVDEKDLARKSYVDSKAASEAAAAVAAIDLSSKADLVDGKVPVEQLPGFVDDVEEYANLESFPAEGSAGKLYVAQNTNKVYRWSGTVYIEIVGSPGSTDEVAEGSINLYFTDERAKLAVVRDELDFLSTDTAPSQRAITEYVSGRLSRFGDSMTGNLLMGENLVKELGEPVEDNDAARKKYVDDGLAAKQDSLGTGTTSQFLRGDLTWQEIEASASVGIAQTKIVSKGGDDVTGDGTLTKPFATIAAAMASITDATPSKRYIIKVEAGAYTEGALALKPNVFVVGDLKEAVRVTATSVTMDASFNAPSSQDHRSGLARIILNGACNFDWAAVSSPAGKLYFTEVSFGSTVSLNGHNNGIAQAQADSCQFFGTLTVSGINFGVFKDNVCWSNVVLNQHPILATTLGVSGGHCHQDVVLTTTVDNFNRRCSAFLRAFNCENLIIDGPSSYADADMLSQGKWSTQKLNGGQYIAFTPQVRYDLETQMLKPISNNAHNSGDWGKQWFFNFAYVHASAGTDMYLLSTMENYDPAGDSAGRAIVLAADGYGLKPDVNGGNIELETAAVSGTGVRGKVQVKARELDMTSAKITNLADGVNPQDAVTKAQLDAAVGGGGLSGKKETFTLSAGDIANAYVDCAHLAAADTMMVMSGGVVHIEGESYTLSNVGGVTRITFIGDLVDPSPSKLEEGDKVHVQYLK